ncbi:MAG: hypothetical protein ACI91Z_001258, partial [Yoonia sp.]
STPSKDVPDIAPNAAIVPVFFSIETSAFP